MLLLQPFLMKEISLAVAQETSKTIGNPEAILAALKQRNIDMDQRELQVREREARLKLLEGEIRLMLDNNQKIVDNFMRLKKEEDQKELERLSDKAKEEELRLVLLAKIYQSMDPKEAASRLSKLKEATALNLLRRIKAKVSAQILSKMSAGKAARYTEVFIEVKE
jgi:flagellar protein FlbB